MNIVSTQNLLGRVPGGATRRSRLAVVVLACVGLAGCVAAPPSGSVVAGLSPCEIVQALVDSHADGFTQLRGPQSDNRFADVWTAKHHAVGNHCEVWGSGRNQFVYICSRSLPNAAAAQQEYESASTTVRECLGGEWRESVQDRGDERGEFTRFARAADGVAVTIQKVRSDSLLRDQWTIHYLVGDQSARNP